MDFIAATLTITALLGLPLIDLGYSYLENTGQQLNATTNDMSTAHDARYFVVGSTCEFSLSNGFQPLHPRGAAA
jgi:hypothetical protein